MTGVSSLSSAMNNYASEARYIAKSREEKHRASGALDVVSEMETGKETRKVGGVSVVNETKRAKEMHTAAEQFSGFFLGFMMKEMRKTVELTPFGHGSDSAEKTFQELADEEYGNEAAKANSNAITEMVYRSLMNGASVPHI